MTAHLLGQELRGILERAAHGYRYTMAVTGFAEKARPLLEFYEREFGGEQGAQVLTAMTLLQGFRNETAEAGAELARLAELATEHPAVAACLREGRYDEIESQPGGSEFKQRFDVFIEGYGWRGDGWGQLELPTWAEEPSKPLLLIARYVEDPEQSPARAQLRSAQQREAAIEDIESRLSADKAAEFRRLINDASAYVPVSESRAMWQLTLGGSLRVPCLALGRKLVEASVLDDANDVFYLHLSELEAAAVKGPDSLTRLVEQRKAEYAAWQKLTPPPFLGTPPQGAPSPDFVLFFGVGEPRVNDNVITGQAASKGVARGRARVILDLSDGGALEAGEVLVCHTTSPPWTPLFATAAAVVTDSGGVLSHSAICAREYAIPCVVATQVATRLIPNGAMVIVDGAAGTVTIEA
jgi:rifampicin phosphotransferase